MLWAKFPLWYHFFFLISLAPTLLIGAAVRARVECYICRTRGFEFLRLVVVDLEPGWLTPGNCFEKSFSAMSRMRRGLRLTYESREQCEK
jgi:hypothetical protein